MRQRRSSSALRRLQAYLAPYHQSSPGTLGKDNDRKDSLPSSAHDIKQDSPRSPPSHGIKQGESLVISSDPPPPYLRSSSSSENTVVLPPVSEETKKADGGELWSGSSRRRPFSSTQLLNQLPVLPYEGRVIFKPRHHDDDDAQP